MYKLYIIENPEIKKYTLILSGEEVPFIEKTKIRNEEIISINDERTAKKNEILKLLDVKMLILISYLNYQNIIKK